MCLGTLIFEHAAGLEEAEKAFGSSERAEATAAKLVELSSWFGFDGWLFNVEVAFKREEGEGEGGGVKEGGEEEERERTRALVDNCLLCLRRTRELCRISASSSTSPHSSPRSSSLVLWYDAVTCDDGSLHWQNGLTEKNARFFFEGADGIFTNYCWKSLSCLRDSARRAEEEEGRGGNRSAAEVWVGADAFGRGSFGGEGTAGVAAAAEAAAEAGSSLAVFAPGWVMEAFEGEEHSNFNAWRARADGFWGGVDRAYRGKRKKKKSESGLRLPLFSAFSSGAGRGWWSPDSEAEFEQPSSFSSSRRVGGPWFHLGLADAPCPSSQRWGYVSVSLVLEGDAVRLSFVVAEAAVVRAGTGGDCEVGGPCGTGCCRLASRCSLDGGGALAVDVSAFGPPAVAGAGSSRSIEFELYGDGGGGGNGCGEEREETEEVVAFRAWVLEGAAASPASPAAASAAAVSLSLVVRGGGGGGSAEAAAERAQLPPPSLLLPLDSSSSLSPSPPSSSPSPSPSSSSSRWRRHERSFSLRELGGRVSSVALRLSVGGGRERESEGGEGGGKGGRGGRPLLAATLGAVALVPGSFRRPESPVASWIALRGRALEWGGGESEGESESESDGSSSSSKVKRWEVWMRRSGGEEELSFLGATRARKWWINGDVRRGDEFFVGAVFADGGREAVSREVQVVAAVE